MQISMEVLVLIIPVVLIVSVLVLVTNRCARLFGWVDRRMQEHQRKKLGL